MKPIYKHDCSECEFIKTITVEGTKYDIYRCGQTGFRLGSSWVARYDDEGSHYWSMPWDVLKGSTLEQATSLMREVYRIACEVEEKRIDAHLRNP